MHTLLPRRWQNYGRKWCKWWPAKAKTLYAGSLMRVWLTMDQKWNQKQWSRRYWQHLRLQADASVRKKRVWLDYLDSCAAGTKATAHLDVPKASSNRDGRLNSNSCPLIFFRHLFALGLPDVSCLASAHFYIGQGPTHLPLLSDQSWWKTFGSHQTCLPKAPCW